MEKLKINLARQINVFFMDKKVATAWTPGSKADRIIVASDSVAKDELQQELIKQTDANGVKTKRYSIQELIDVAKDPRFGNTQGLLSLIWEAPYRMLFAPSEVVFQ